MSGGEVVHMAAPETLAEVAAAAGATVTDLREYSPEDMVELMKDVLGMNVIARNKVLKELKPVDLAGEAAATVPLSFEVDLVAGKAGKAATATAGQAVSGTPITKPLHDAPGDTPAIEEQTAATQPTTAQSPQRGACSISKELLLKRTGIIDQALVRAATHHSCPARVRTTFCAMRLIGW